jgi:hypothetical protein
MSVAPPPGFLSEIRAALNDYWSAVAAGSGEKMRDQSMIRKVDSGFPKRSCFTRDLESAGE